MGCVCGVVCLQDGNIHCHVNNVSAKASHVRDRSAIAAASYNSGTEIYSNKEKRFVAVRDTDDVTFADILLPTGDADWALDRGTLWNRVEAGAKRSDARLAKKIEVAFTRDILPALRIELLRDFARQFTQDGCIADVAIHADALDHNPHAHILLTTRVVDGDGFGAKIKALDQRKFITDTRAQWARLSNIYLEKSGSAVRVDHRSYKARGIEATPTRHRGPEQYLERPPVREHASRVAQHHPQGQERVMEKPTHTEVRDYPSLAARDTWPPEREPAQDMTVQERDEHQRYWQEQDIEEIDRLAREFDQEHDVGWPELEQPEPVQDKYAAAVRQARFEADQGEFAAVRTHREDATQERDMRQERSAYHDDVYRRALELNRTPEENELLRMAQGGSAEMKQYIRDEIIQKRMQKVQDADHARRRAELEKSMDVAERERLASLLDKEVERDLPELGPERELRPQHEIEAARDEMLREVERDEWERERDR